MKKRKKVLPLLLLTAFSLFSPPSRASTDDYVTLSDEGLRISSGTYQIFEEWSELNDPLRIDGSFERRLGSLPLSGSLSTPPWSDTYWPSYQGGIAHRWNMSRNSGSGAPFYYRTLSPGAVSSLSPQQLASLSPAEKYDIFKGDFSYPTVRKELELTSPSNPTWYGLCHGWSAAAVNFSAEPRAITLTSPSGIQIPFAASDVKALLAYYIGNIAKPKPYYIGKKCDEVVRRSWFFGMRRRSLVNCDLTNAGAFHIFLTNKIGLLNQSFVADISRNEEIWNFPIHSYSSRIIDDRGRHFHHVAPGTVRVLTMETQLNYAVETNASWGPIGSKVNSKVYQYTVELDGNGEIIGGEWVHSDPPKFLWVQERPVFEGYYREISDIYNQSLR